MSDYRKILSEDVELSKLVLEKTDRAFALIQKEDHVFMEKKEQRAKKIWKTQAAAIAGICILALSGVSAYAAVRHYWGRGINDMLQASDSEQQELTENGVAKVYREDTDHAAYAVTDQGVTIAPATVIVDELFAYLTLDITGYTVENGEEAGFRDLYAYLGDDPQAEDAWVNVSGTMCDTAAADGTLEYMIWIDSADEQASLLGKTLHVGLQSLGTVARAETDTAVDGCWELTLPLADVSMAKEFSVEQTALADGFSLETVRISPISVAAYYAAEKAPEVQGDDLGIPCVTGVVLKDGTRLTELTNGGRCGYTDEAGTTAYQLSRFSRVIDTDEVSALLVTDARSQTVTEVPLLN